MQRNALRQEFMSIVSRWRELVSNAEKNEAIELEVRIGNFLPAQGFQPGCSGLVMDAIIGNFEEADESVFQSDEWCE